jgi:hypothetical protein
MRILELFTTIFLKAEPVKLAKVEDVFSGYRGESESGLQGVHKTLIKLTKLRAHCSVEGSESTSNALTMSSSVFGTSQLISYLPGDNYQAFPVLESGRPLQEFGL